MCGRWVGGWVILWGRALVGDEVGRGRGRGRVQAEIHTYLFDIAVKEIRFALSALRALSRMRELMRCGSVAGWLDFAPVQYPMFKTPAVDYMSADDLETVM